MFNFLGGLAAMIVSAAGSPAQAPSTPIRVVAEPVAEGLRIRVIGASVAEYDADFVLEVTSGGNRSLHRGSARLGGGEPVVLSTVTLGGGVPAEWRAHLRVQPRGGEEYEELKASF